MGDGTLKEEDEKERGVVGIKEGAEINHWQPDVMKSTPRKICI